MSTSEEEEEKKEIVLEISNEYENKNSDKDLIENKANPETDEV